MANDPVDKHSRTDALSFRNMDLQGVDLTGRVLFGADFSGANLHRARISLTCSTFEGATFDEDQVALILLLVSKANINQEYKDSLRDLVHKVLGPQRALLLERYLRLVN